jgi:Dual specificity phosphatase, catalytic domain
VYGQSRSAAVVVSYLLSEGMQIDDAVQLVKERRPVTCINPGFLSQLLLLSRRNSQLAQIQLVMRGIIRCRGLKTFNINTAETMENSKGALTSEYFDCYKPVNVADRKYQHSGSRVMNDGSRDVVQCDARIDINTSDIILDSVGQEQQQQGQGQQTSSTAIDGTTGILCAALEVEVDESQMSTTTTESVECGKCRHVLANDLDIVRAVDYSEFLSNTTDDYWVGYTSIHSSGGHALSFEKCRKVKRKGLNLNGKSVVAANKKRSNGTKSNIMQKDSREQLTNDKVEHDIEDLVIVGPLDWILSQLSEESGCNASTHASAIAGPAPGTGQGQSSQCSVQSRVRGNIRCPNCRVMCGHYKDNGLDLCNSFIRCELFALHRSKITITRSPSVADV